MNTGQCRVFAKVVELRSFSAAARELYVSPQSVAQQVGRLERELGVSLLDRTAQGVRPTRAGMAFYEGVVRIDRDLEALVARCREVARPDRAVIRMGASDSYALNLFARFVPNFLREHPDTDVARVPVGADPVADLRAGAYDVVEGVRDQLVGARVAASVEPGEGAGDGAGAAVRASAGEGAGEGARDVAFMELVRVRRCCVVSTSSALAHRDHVTPRDLVGQRAYVFSLEWARELQAYLDEACPGVELQEMPERDLRAAIRLAEDGDAVYLVPTTIADQYNPLISIPFAADVACAYGLLFLERQRARLGGFLACARAAFPEARA